VVAPRRRRLAASWVVLLGLGLAACATPSEADQRAALVRDASAAIGGYVSALRRGDLAVANEHRCAAARLAPEDQEAFLTPVAEDLDRDLGGLAVASLEIINRIEGVTHVRLRLRGADAPVYPALVKEDGELRLCGATIDHAAELVASAKTRDGSDERSGATLDDLVGRLQPAAGFHQATGVDLSIGLLDAVPGFRSARGVRWDEDAGARSVSITVVDLDTAAHARAAQRVLEGELLDAVTDPIPGPTPAARGFRYLAGYQLFLQSPGTGSVGDYVGFRWDTRVVAIYVVPLTAADDHALVLDTAAELLAAAQVGG
jgi:hypothetical protein